LAGLRHSTCSTTLHDRPCRVYPHDHVADPQARRLAASRHDDAHRGGSSQVSAAAAPRASPCWNRRPPRAGGAARDVEAQRSGLPEHGLLNRIQTANRVAVDAEDLIAGMQLREWRAPAGSWATVTESIVVVASSGVPMVAAIVA